ncbi:MAG TPA: hypothetical protein VN279_04895, partial [Rhodocyclaceae bacterium]|nr:hypothetical protein [Rhodocyclaceae bacterium]
MNLKHIVAALGIAATVAAAPALADTPLKFDGAIGSQPLRANAAVNAVRGVNPGGIPWVIRTFRADIKPASPAGRGAGEVRILARGEGLLLGGGDTVGARGGTRFVVAALFCRDSTGASVGPFHSAPADLDVNGDFLIDSPLADSAGAAPPAVCGDRLDNRPVLLIRSAA